MTTETLDAPSMTPAEYEASRNAHTAAVHAKLYPPQVDPWVAKKAKSSRVLAAVAEYLHVAESEVMGYHPAGVLKIAHGVAVYLHRELLGMTQAEVARTFNRDHQTVKKTLERIVRELHDDPVLKRWVQEIEQQTCRHEAAQPSEAPSPAHRL